VDLSHPLVAGTPSAPRRRIVARTDDLVFILIEPSAVRGANPVQLKKTLCSVLLIGLFIALLVPLRPATAQRGSEYEWIDPIVVLRRILLEGYHEQPDEEAMQHAMLTAMADVLDDPYTVYVPPAAEVEFNKAMRGTYVGIGAEVDIVDNYLTIVSPLEDSPALDAGVKAGDIVLEIEGASTIDRSIDDCIETLLGEPGTPVDIRVRHLDGSEETLTIVRQKIVTPTVKGVRRDGDTWDFWLDERRRIGFVRLSQFTRASTEALEDVLLHLTQGGLGGLVLDLRGNPGGELTVAIDVADLFLDEGLIVSVKGRGQAPQSWQAKRNGTLPDFPMIVLVNRHSASAAEIVAGALQVNGRARVLGTRTFGKGSVQEVRDLPYDQGTIKLTTAHYYLPGGRNISRTNDDAVWGVDPDEGFVVKMGDEAFVDMILARRRFEVIRPESGPQQASFDDPRWIRETLSDVQLAAALEAMRQRLDAGTWPVLGNSDATQLALEQRIEDQWRLRRHILARLDDVDQRLRELHELAEDSGRAPLLPADADLTGGTLAVRDRQGNLIGAYRLVEGDLEVALQKIELTPIDEDDAPP
jgi:carboxyl-terminal processing protease